MSDTFVVIDGKSVKLVDNGDGTYSPRQVTKISQISGENSINMQIGGTDVSEANPVPVSSTLSKPSDTILIGTGATHSAGDVVSTDTGDILEFETGLPAGSGGIILKSIVTLNQDVVFSGGAGYTLHLFNVSPTVQATNAVFDLDSVTGYLGTIEISTLIDKGSNCVAEDKEQNTPFVLAAEDTKLYAKAVCKGGEVTVSGKTLAFNLFIIGG